MRSAGLFPLAGMRPSTRRGLLPRTGMSAGLPPRWVACWGHHSGDGPAARDDLPHGELDQFAARVIFADALRQQLVELLACPFRGRYSRLHGDASSCRRRQPATLGFESKQECIPVSFSSKYRTSPSEVVAGYESFSDGEDADDPAR